MLVELLGTGAAVRIVPEQLYHVFYRMGSNTRRKDKREFSRVFVDIVDNADFIEELVGKTIRRFKRRRCASGCSSGWTICSTSRWR